MVFFFLTICWIQVINYIDLKNQIKVKKIEKLFFAPSSQAYTLLKNAI